MREDRAGTNQEAGADAEALEGCSLLACSCSLSDLLSYSTQDTLPRDGIIHSRLGPSPSIIDQENTHIQSDGGIPPLHRWL